MRKLLILILTFSVLLSIPMAAYAHDVPQERNDCSIEVIVRYDGKNVNSGTLTAVKVGYVAEGDGNYFFNQEMTGVKLENVISPEVAAVQKKFYDDNKDNFNFYTQTQSVKDGKATFSSLSTGLYLIVQNKVADGFSKLGAFLVSVPYMKDGEYQYHVATSIKSELKREPEPTDPKPTEPEDPKLPQTGQLNWPIPVMVVAGLAFFVVGWALCFGKKRDQNEK